MYKNKVQILILKKSEIQIFWLGTQLGSSDSDLGFHTRPRYHDLPNQNLENGGMIISPGRQDCILIDYW